MLTTVMIICGQRLQVLLTIFIAHRRSTKMSHCKFNKVKINPVFNSLKNMEPTENKIPSGVELHAHRCSKYPAQIKFLNCTQGVMSCAVS